VTSEERLLEEAEGRLYLLLTTPGREAADDESKALFHVREALACLRGERGEGDPAAAASWLAGELKGEDPAEQFRALRRLFIDLMDYTEQTSACDVYVGLDRLLEDKGVPHP
jgi:hypothetical protein